MRVLILGGTRFVGRHVTEAALAGGHDVTLFHRGSTGSDLFPDISRRLGDRLEDVSALESGEWDATLDISAYVPRAVSQAAQVLGPRAGHYVLVSTISVYQAAKNPVTETSPLIELDDPTVEAITAETYGGLKVLCERETLAHFPGASIVRPTYVVGPYDHTQRFSKWVNWIRDGEAIVMPKRVPQSTPFQWIDGRDLAQFILKCAETQWSGVANACQSPMALETVARSIAQTVGRPLKLSFVEEPVENLPLCAPPSGEVDGLMQASNDAAVKAGLEFRSLEDTIRSIVEPSAPR